MFTSRRDNGDRGIGASEVDIGNEGESGTDHGSHVDWMMGAQQLAVQMTRELEESEKVNQEDRVKDVGCGEGEELRKRKSQ